MRVFLAINFPKIIKRELVEIQKELDIKGCKLVNPENLHLTLSFFGEVREEKINRLSEILEQFTESISQFEVELHSLGVFPNINSPRVVWVDVKSEKLTNSGGKLNLLLSKKGFPIDQKPFSPHLTLARIKFQTDETRPKLAQAISRYKGREFGIIKVSSIDIMQSVLDGDGPRYRVIEKCELKG